MGTILTAASLTLTCSEFQTQLFRELLKLHMDVLPSQIQGSPKWSHLPTSSSAPELPVPHHPPTTCDSCLYLATQLPSPASSDSHPGTSPCHCCLPWDGSLLPSICLTVNRPLNLAPQALPLLLQSMHTSPSLLFPRTVPIVSLSYSKTFGDSLPAGLGTNSFACHLRYLEVGFQASFSMLISYPSS